jgi:tetratricopeptide (TPR) repeat protein/predicted Ser/Thr protein kinase
MKHETVVPIGSGGMGEVFKAWDPHLQRQVALKYLRHDDPVLVERLLREARAQARVDHPSVCKVYEVGEEDGRSYIAMEYVDGEPLDVAAKRLTLEQKILLIKKVTEAVQAAHSAGLVHRDLKPANILVTDHDGEAHPYVLDFGIARMEELAGLTVTGQVMGTPGYLSPEQARGDIDAIDRRTDVFSLGVILYELLGGARPFDGDSNISILVNLLEEDPVPLRKRSAAVPRDIETVVMACLEKEPERRYPSARALADDLGRWLAGEPVAAHRLGVIDRIARTVRRNRAVAVTAAVFVVIGIAGAVKYAVDLSRQRQRAERARDGAETLVRFMLRDLFTALQPIGRLDLLDAVSREAAAHYQRFGDAELGSKERVGRAIVLNNLAEVQDAQGHLVEGLDGHRRAAAILREEAAAPGAPPEWLAELAGTLSAVAESLQETGDLGGALGELNAGLRVARELVDDHPDEPRWQAVVVELLINVGWVLREDGDSESALAHLDEALDLANAASEVEPENTEWRFRRAEVESYIARVLEEDGRFDRAALHLDNARRLLTDLADSEPGNTRWQFELVLTDGRLGWLAEDRGDPEGALADYRRGLDRGLRLVEHDPANARWEREVSVLHSSVGAILLAREQAAAARESFAAGLEISERLVSRSPASPSAVNDLAWDWLQLGAAEDALGHDAEARRASERAVELMAPVVAELRELWYLDTWAIALLRLGRVDEARSAVAELLAQDWDEPDFLDLVRLYDLLPTDDSQPPRSS